MKAIEQLHQILGDHAVIAASSSVEELAQDLERLLREENGRGYDEGKANGGRMALRAAEEWKARAWGALRDAESILARHRRHLARLRWRREFHKNPNPKRDRLTERQYVEQAWGKGELRLARWCRGVGIAGPAFAKWSGYLEAEARAMGLPGDGTRPAGVLP